MARAGVWPGTTQASQTSFMAAKSAMSASQTIVCRMRDLSVPAAASSRSTSASACFACVFTSAPGSPTWPAT